MGILHQLRNLLVEVLRDRVQRLAKWYGAQRMTKPGLRCDRHGTWKVSGGTELLILRNAPKTKRCWEHGLRAEAVRLASPSALHPGISLCIRIKHHRCLL